MKDKILPYLIPAAAIGLSFVLVFYIVIPRYGDIKTLRKERESYKNQLTSIKAKTERLSKLFASSEVIRNYDQLLTKALPDGEEVPTLMNQVQDIATESAVEIKNMQFSRGGSGQVVSGQVAKGVLVSLSVGGNFSIVQTFLKNVENASRLLDISGITFSSKAGDITANIQLRSFYYIPEEVKSIDEPVTLDLNDPAFGTLMAAVKELKYYETVVDVEEGIGKPDPFRRD